MVDFVGQDAKEIVEQAVRKLITAEHYRAGSIVSLPVKYPSGATVVLEITLQAGRCFISDRGGAHEEADLYGSLRYFKAEASRIAERASIRFDGRDMFVAEVPVDRLHGAMIVVANCSAEAAMVASFKAADRADKDARDELYSRLLSIFRDRSVQRDAEVVGASNHKWRVSVVVSDRHGRAFFEPVTHHYVSVVSVAAKFHDFASIERAPPRFSVVRSRNDLGDFFGVVAAASTKVIPITATDEQFGQLLEAA